jgi:hypothetical protein
MADDPTEPLHLVERLCAGDRQALTDRFQRPPLPVSNAS